MKLATLFAAGLLGLAFLPAGTAQAQADLACTLRFSLSGWSIFYKHAEGNGVVTCANGQSMRVVIAARGGGLTVGKTHIDNGTGKFTRVHHIDDVLGTYAQGDASIGALKAGTAQVLTKGDVSLALSGAGEGIALGISVGGVTLRRAD